MAWFTYYQKGWGGFFDGPDFVIVEAETATQADDRAEASGYVYFDGVSDGRDCECCGDRWSRAWVSDGEDEPLIFGDPVLEYEPWRNGEALLVYADGRQTTIQLRRKA